MINRPEVSNKGSHKSSPIVGGFMIASKSKNTFYSLYHFLPSESKNSLPVIRSFVRNPEYPKIDFPKKEFRRLHLKEISDGAVPDLRPHTETQASEFSFVLPWTCLHGAFAWSCNIFVPLYTLCCMEWCAVKKDVRLRTRHLFRNLFLVGIEKVPCFGPADVGMNQRATQR